MSVTDNYKKLLNEIQQEAINCGRDPSKITLLAVTKTHPLSHVMPAYDTGCRDFGENKVQEALQKIPEAPDDIRWHLIGTLQKNKVRKVIGKFHLIHSVDSLELAQKISQCSEEEGTATNVLLQVNASGEETKHGFTPGELQEGIAELIESKGIAIKGLMTMAPFVEDEIVIRDCFRKLRELRDNLQSKAGGRAELNELSMGMTHDYSIAIEEGATILRIGTAIFGRR